MSFNGKGQCKPRRALGYVIAPELTAWSRQLR